MQESSFRELVRRNDLYVKVGQGYRLINLDTDTSGDLIDLDHTMYYRNQDKSYEVLPGLAGSKGDIEMPVEVDALPEPGVKPLNSDFRYLKAGASCINVLWRSIIVPFLVIVTFLVLIWFCKVVLGLG